MVMIIAVLISCGNSDGEILSETNAETDYKEVVGFPKVDEYVDELAKGRDFGGTEFRIIGGGKVIFPETEAETGNLENDTLYYRSRDIEEKFGVDVTFTEATGIGYYDLESEINDLVLKDVMSDGRTYDMIEGSIKLCGTVMLSTNLLRTVDDMDSIDLEQSWWIDGLREQYVICDRLFYLTGKINLSHYNDPSCVLFNTDVATNFGLPDLYEIVERGEWTLDKMYETASAIPPGSDVKRYMLDYEYGLSLFFGGGFSLCEQDKDGNPVIVSMSSDMVSYIEKIRSGFADDSVAFNGLRAYFLGKEDYYDRDTFEGDKALYWVDCMWRAIDMRPYDVEFGILPVPKRDLEQKEYIAYSNSSNGVYFEKATKDPEMSGVITEAMAALSEKYVEPLYYEKSLKGRSTYDEQSRAVLDIVYNSRRVDLLATYRWANIAEMLNKACSGITDSYVSSYAGSLKYANIQIKQLISKVEKYE